jgi:predicted flavoprotein YhiN
MEAEGDSVVVADSGAAVTEEGATEAGVDWVAEVGAEAGMDSAAATEQGFKIQGSVAWSLYIML